MYPGLFFYAERFMRYPNLRYGNPTEFAHYVMGRDLKDVARQLRRDEKTVRDWLSGRARVPWWVPELLRLKHLEGEQYRRMLDYYSGQKRSYARLGVVMPDNTLQLHQNRVTVTKIEKPQETTLRLDDFEQLQRLSAS